MEDLNLQFNNEVMTEPHETKQLNFFQRVLGVIVSPEQTMKNLAAKPRILFPILIMVFGVLLLYILRFSLFQDTIRTAIENSLNQGKTPQMTKEQVDLAIKIGSITGLIGVIIAPLFAWLAGTAVLFAVIKMFKGQGSFKQYMSITGYAYVITLMFLILTGIASYFTGNLELDLSLGVISSLLIQDPSSSYLSGFMAGLLKSIAIFSIWKYVVIAIGVTIVSAIPKKKVYYIVFGIFLLGALVTAFFAGFSGIK